jgi:hypothetical protein
MSAATKEYALVWFVYESDNFMELTTTIGACGDKVGD